MVLDATKGGSNGAVGRCAADLSDMTGTSVVSGKRPKRSPEQATSGANADSVPPKRSQSRDSAKGSTSSAKRAKELEPAAAKNKDRDRDRGQRRDDEDKEKEKDRDQRRRAERGGDKRRRRSGTPSSGDSEKKRQAKRQKTSSKDANTSSRETAENRKGSGDRDQRDKRKEKEKEKDKEKHKDKDKDKVKDKDKDKEKKKDKERDKDKEKDKSKEKEASASAIQNTIEGEKKDEGKDTSNKSRSSRWGPPLEEPQPPLAGSAPGAPQMITPEAARVEVARLGSLGQPTPQWLIQAAWGSGSTPTPVPAGATIGGQPAASSEKSAAVAARQAAMAKARQAAPPPPWMAAAAIHKKAPGEAGGSAGSDGGSKKKLDLTDLSSLQKALTEDRNKLRLFVIKAKQDFDDRKESGKTDGTQGQTDDNEYYSASAGEEFGPAGGPQFKVEGPIGRGVFSSVYKCKGSTDGKDYAVKFIRSNAMMKKAAEKEVEMYRRLAQHATNEDPEGARYLINLASATFEHHGHLCFVFELLRCDMRFALQKYGQGAGLPLPTLAQYVRQIFLGLRALRKLKVVHADMKPDNVLMTMNKAEIQICDFGSGMDVSEQTRSSYLQPRYYRAPEVMLGLPYDMQIDVWSVGTMVFELATGRILFTGKTNNQMLKQMIDVCGGFCRRMVQEGEFSKKHFNVAGEFLNKDPDSITGELSVIPARVSKPQKPVSGLLQAALTTPSAGVELAIHDRWVAQLAELIDKCLCTEPLERIQPEQALELSFFKKER